MIAWAAVALAASSGLLLQQFVKPRLPVYTLQIQSLPWLEWIRGELQTRLSTHIDLHNDNYMQIDVHGLAFDMFYMNWEGELSHIGRIQDVHLVQLEPNATLSWRNATPPLWQIAPRADFSSSAELYVVCFLSRLYGSLSRLVWSIWRGGGSLVIPTTGVAFIKASSATPFTVSIVCDNLVDTFSMKVQGLECVLKQLKPGWSLPAVDSLRDYALKTLRGNATGGVLEHPTSVSWDEIIRRIAYEEILQLP